MPADGQPIVGWLPGANGLYVAVTHSGVTLGAHLATHNRRARQRRGGRRHRDLPARSLHRDRASTGAELT
jgi:hypothetical protein